MVANAEDMVGTSNRIVALADEKLALAQVLVDNAARMVSNAEDIRKHSDEIKKNADEMVGILKSVHANRIAEIKCRAYEAQYAQPSRPRDAYFERMQEDWLREKRAEWVATGSNNIGMPFDDDLPEPSDDRKGRFDTAWIAHLRNQLGHGSNEVWEAFTVWRSLK